VERKKAVIKISWASMPYQIILAKEIAREGPLKDVVNLGNEQQQPSAANLTAA
jgi:hypothetical protein